MISEIGIGAMVVAWFGSLELRARNFVGKDRFNDLKEDVCHVKEQTTRIETKIDTLLINNVRSNGKK